MVDSQNKFLELRLPVENDYESYLEWKRIQEKEQQENKENDQRVIIIEI